MRDLIKHEQFELEALSRLNSGKLLAHLIFSGGTMLRLCYGLDRYSVDLDFWLVKELDTDRLYEKMVAHLSRYYTIRDAANKHYSLVVEIGSTDYPRSLKIEVRKENKKVKTEPAIAYGKNSSEQVLLNVVSLPDMMQAKIAAFLDRKEIRDVFDLEFLFKKGVPVEASKDVLGAILREIDAFTKNDYKVKLGSLLAPDQRKYYSETNFKILKMALQEKLV